MKFKDWKTNKGWVSIFAESGLEGDWLTLREGEGHEDRIRLGQTLREALQNDHLALLCGAGTSLDLNMKEGRPVHPPIAPSMTDLWKVVRVETDAMEAGLFQKVLNYVNYNPPKHGENLETLLAACRISEQFRSTPWVKSFLEKAESEIVRLCQIPQGTEDLSVHENFLRRLAQRPADMARIKMFTTNYDRCLETAAAHVQCVVLDGFSYTFPRLFDASYFAYDWVRRDESGDTPRFIPNLIHFYKLHGSVDWEKTPAGVVKNPGASRPLLLYPNGENNEFALESPFLDMMAQFQAALRLPKTSLVVIGFGFRDAHLTHPILQAIRHNPDLRLVCVSKELDLETNPCLRALDALTKSGDGRVSFLQCSFEEFVRIMPNLAQPAPGQNRAEHGTSLLKRKCA